ncbi:MAG: hypothetical protein QM236_07450 [Bacillota bacterium]|nr:hypothetical protein [Bacillota bacterium]HOA55942.1 hypothetical protein [Clostridiales bacterium]HQD31498.1 hypothetical protein [Clostridiales bacterium]
MIVVRNTIKTIVAIGIIAVLVYIALKLLGFALRVVLPIAILAFIAYIIYVLVTGRRPRF